jgi:hypothetical protein
MAGLPLSLGHNVITVTTSKRGPANLFAGISPPTPYKAKTPVQTEERADERGMEIRYPKDDELFVDIDSARDFTRFKTMVEMLGRIERVKGWTDTPSASGGQHRHVVVTLGRHVGPLERVALQAMLGSDLKREMLSYEQLKTGSNPHPTVFFEPRAGVQPKAKKTGFNCTRCNFKNDFAEANQDDGTYLCFNCRVEE